MKILSLSRRLTTFLKKRGLEEKFKKQRNHLEHNFTYPSLETELLEPKELRLWSFRIDRKYRAIFIFRKKDTIEIIDINNHYE